MAGSLVHFTNFPSMGFHGYTKGTSFQDPHILGVRAFSGFRGMNALDNKVLNVGHTSHTKVITATASIRLGKVCRILPRAFERFDAWAVHAIFLAQEESRRLGHNFVGTGQILLGLIGNIGSIASEVLKSIGIKLTDARIEVEKIIGRGCGFVSVDIPFTPRAKRVLELTLEEARRLGHNYIGSEHLLLGLILENEGDAARVIQTLGVDPNYVGTMVEAALETSADPAKIVPDEEAAAEASEMLPNEGMYAKALETAPRAMYENENLSEEASRVIMLAHEESRRLGCCFLRTEQILLGLIGEGTGIAAKVLKSAGINLKDARVKAEKIIDRSNRFVPVDMPSTSHTKRVLELALEKAHQLGQHDIRSEHLLLGLLSEACGGTRVLQALGCDVEEIRIQVAAAATKSLGRDMDTCLTVEGLPFEGLTEEAIKVIFLAREESNRLGHSFIGTEQILIGLIGEGTNVAPKVLKCLGISIEDALAEVEKIIGQGRANATSLMPFTARAKRVFRYSQAEAHRLGHDHVAPEHIFLGLLRDGQGVGARVLENLGANVNNIREILGLCGW